MSDTRLKNADPNGAVGSNDASGTDPTHKRLGRGFEEISHLFMSQPPDQPALRPSERPALARFPLEHDASLVLLKPHRGVAKDRLIAALQEFSGDLEEGLRVIDAKVACDPCGEIDMIAVDGANQLTIVDVGTIPNDGLLLRGIDQCEWVLRNFASIGRMYHGYGIDVSRQPRLLLVAPQFTALLERVACQMTRPRIDLMKYHVLEGLAGNGIFFEHSAGE